MPETFGLPEPEEPEDTPAEQAQAVLAEAIAGQSVVRRTVLWAVLFGGLAMGNRPGRFAATVAGALLIATDTGLSE